MSIVVVDDSADDVYIFEELLKRVDPAKEVKSASNGQKGLELVREQADKLSEELKAVFLDIQMPIMSGFEFLEHYEGLRAKGKKKAPIFILTNSNNDSDYDKVHKYNCVKDFLRKPIDEDRLKALLRTYCEK